MEKGTSPGGHEPMNSHPFVRKTNDLLIMLIAGMAIVAITQFIYPLPAQKQFLMMLGFGFVSGLFLSSLLSSIEWALFFFMGVQIMTLTPSMLNFILADSNTPLNLAPVIFESSRYSLFLLSSWIISIPVGYMLQKLVMSNYFKERLF